MGVTPYGRPPLYAPAPPKPEPMTDEPQETLEALRKTANARGLPWSINDTASDIRCTLDYYANFKGADPFADRKFSPMKVPLEAVKEKPQDDDADAVKKVTDPRYKKL